MGGHTSTSAGGVRQASEQLPRPQPMSVLTWPGRRNMSPTAREPSGQCCKLVEKVGSKRWRTRKTLSRTTRIKGMITKAMSTARVAISCFVNVHFKHQNSCPMTERGTRCRQSIGAPQRAPYATLGVFRRTHLKLPLSVEVPAPQHRSSHRRRTTYATGS